MPSPSGEVLNKYRMCQHTELLHRRHLLGRVKTAKPDRLACRLRAVAGALPHRAQRLHYSTNPKDLALAMRVQI